MKEFFDRLVRQEKLKLVEPSEEIKSSYIEKSKSNLSSAKILLENDKLEEVIALSYYRMYNIVIALFKIGIKCENHKASIILLKELFDIDNFEIELAKKERIDKQYYTDFEIFKEEVLSAIESAEKFNYGINDFILKLNIEKRRFYREKFKELIKF